MLFSATQTKNVADLARLSIQGKPVYVGVDDKESEATVSSLVQGYVVCPSDQRFLLLFTFLKKNLNKKIMVFFSSCNSVKYHSELLNYIDIPVSSSEAAVWWSLTLLLLHVFQVMDIHGKYKQQKRTSTFVDFCNAKVHVLWCASLLCVHN